jgi:DNA polymerase
MIYSIDFETRSRIDLVNRGLDVYANDPSTEVICIAFGTDPDAILVRHPQFKIDELLEHVRNGGKIQAWNAMFEYAIWNCVCVPKYGWPPLKIAQCIDSMATAAANNIPQSLEDAALFLGTIEQKDPEGKKLIMKLSKPQKDGTFNMDPDLIGKMFDYCAQDVRTEMSVV